MTAALLFEVWPYAAVILFVGGVIGRALQMRRRLPASPYELGRASAEFGRGRLWRLSLGLLLVAHVVGLTFPRLVLAWNAAPWRLYLVEGLGLLVGLTAAVGCARLIARYLDRPPGGAAAELADSIFFSLLFVAISSGVATAVAYRWASSWGAATLAPYAASLARGAPSAVLVDHLPFLARVHVVASVTALAALPFSRLALFLVVALHRAVVALAAAGEAGAARARVVVEGRKTRRQSPRLALARGRGALGRGVAGRGGPGGRESGRARATPREGRPAVRVGVLTMRLGVAIVGFGALGLGGGLAASGASHLGVHQGYAPEQPIAFPHRVHAGDNQIPCAYCHSGVRTSRHAGIPSASVCMNCHALLERQTTEIEKLKEAVQLGRPIAWVKVHNLPDFVSFNHSRHVLGGVACARCHGAIEQMDRVRQVSPLTMGWCLDCHRERAGVPQGGVARAAARIANGPPHATGLDCVSCHY